MAAASSTVSKPAANAASAPTNRVFPTKGTLRPHRSGNVTAGAEHSGSPDYKLG